MKANPLILNSLDDAGRRLARIEAQPHDPKNEAWLQELLHRHPELLPVDAFDDAFGPPISIGREVATGRGPIDNLFVSVEGGLTVVETKLWRNPEKHRTVVAQIIDYAKELATWDYDGLCSAVLDSSRRRGEKEKPSLEEKVTRTLRKQKIELHEFQENVARCLAEGNFLLLIVGDRIPPNLALLTQAIQSAPGLGFTLGLVEMQLYAAEPGKEWPLIIVPEVMGRTVEKTRGIVRVRYDQEKPQVQVEVEGDGVPTKLDFELFLKEIPQDVVQPFREAAEKCEQMGGILETPGRTIHFSMALPGGASPDHSVHDILGASGDSSGVRFVVVGQNTLRTLFVEVGGIPGSQQPSPQRQALDQLPKPRPRRLAGYSGCWHGFGRVGEGRRGRVSKGNVVLPKAGAR